jgi:hypothetical protein
MGEWMHRDVPWDKARIPRRRHKCRWQSYRATGDELVEFCACGALRRNYGDGKGTWMFRNSRRRGK